MTQVLDARNDSHADEEWCDTKDNFADDFETENNDRCVLDKYDDIANNQKNVSTWWVTEVWISIFLHENSIFDLGLHTSAGNEYCLANECGLGSSLSIFLSIG